MLRPEVLYTHSCGEQYTHLVATHPFWGTKVSDAFNQLLVLSTRPRLGHHHSAMSLPPPTAALSHTGPTVSTSPPTAVSSAVLLPSIPRPLHTDNELFTALGAYRDIASLVYEYWEGEPMFLRDLNRRSNWAAADPGRYGNCSAFLNVLDKLDNITIVTGWQAYALIFTAIELMLHLRHCAHQSLFEEADRTYVTLLRKHKDVINPADFLRYSVASNTAPKPNFAEAGYISDTIGLWGTYLPSLMRGIGWWSVWSDTEWIRSIQGGPRAVYAALWTPWEMFLDTEEAPGRLLTHHWVERRCREGTLELSSDFESSSSHGMAWFT